MPRSPELPWTPAETKRLMSHAEVVAALRDKVEKGTATKEEVERFGKAVLALDKAIKDKEREAGHSPDTILAEDREGNEIRFDLAELRRQWVDFYKTNNLSDVLTDDGGRDTIPSNITLTPEQIDLLKAKAKEGYTRAVIIPAGIEKHLQALKENLTDGYEKDRNNKPILTFLSSNVSPSFPDNIITTDTNRKDKAYIILTNPNESLLPNSKNKTADELMSEFQSLGFSGLTLADFFIEERRHFNETGKHLIDGSVEWSWLLASRDSASRVLDAGWRPGSLLVGVGSGVSGDRDPALGARPSVVFVLET